MASLVQIAAPALEPVSVAELKTYIRLDSDFDTDDALLAAFIVAARRHAEMLTSRSFITQQWRMRLDGFTQCGYAGGGMDIITLDRGPIQSIDSINYLDTARAQQTADLSTVATDLESRPPRISPRFGQVWPVPICEIGSVWIEYTAGFGDTEDDVPQVVRQWIFARASTINTHRELVEVMNRGKLEELPYIDGMLDSETVVTL